MDLWFTSLNAALVGGIGRKLGGIWLGIGKNGRFCGSTFAGYKGFN